MGSNNGQHVAVVGSGISGISTAWLLHRSGFKVTIFEKEATCGGHTLTDDSGPVPVDLGFQVFNFTNYPNFVGFLKCLGVDSEPSDMSFALSVDGGGLEWASFGLHTIFAQRKNLASPSFWLMIADVLRFNSKAPEVLDKAKAEFKGMTLGQYLKRGRYSQIFCAKYLLPMCAAIWSVSTASVLDFPVQKMVQFWVNHHLLSLLERPLWRVVKDRSRSYLEAVLREVTDVHTSTEVVGLERSTRSPMVHLLTKGAGGCTNKHTFDQVVLACHSDQSLSILGDGATALEREVLGGIPYNMNDVYLHSDPALMPRNKACWASWNCLEDKSVEVDALGASKQDVCVTYWLNHLQNLPEGTPDLLCTLNPIKPPREGTVLRHLRLAHPVFGPDGDRSQEMLPQIQGKSGVWFAGAWAGYGFHEDGLKAGIAVAQGLGATIPWTPRPTSPNITLMGRLYLSLFCKFASAAIVRGHMRVLLPDGSEVAFGRKLNPGEVGESYLDRLSATMRVMDMKGLERVVKTADIGLGEAFMLREIETDDLVELMWLVSGNAKTANSNLGKMGMFNWLGMAAAHVAHRFNANTVEGSRRNISAHYDAGNEMYKLFLDSTMMYSSAIHTPQEIEIAYGAKGQKVELREAQIRKLNEIIDRAGITSEHHVLEIGCGWGGFAIQAAKRTGCKITGITISKEQLVEAQARVKAEGLDHLIDLRFCDYRHLPSVPTFHRVVSIEMIEAVGHEHLQSYFDVISRVLLPGGKACIQVITRKDEGYEAYTASSDFIRAHIFPGGHLPCMAAMVECAQRTAAPLCVADCKDIGVDYAVTLNEWRRRWNAQHPELLALGYDDVFIRKYDFYFAYCEAAFAVKYIHDYIITWKHASSTAAGEIGTSAAPVATGGPTSTDRWTQLMFALYIFLCGVCVGRTDGLWLAPITAGSFVLVAAMVSCFAPRSLHHSKVPRWSSAICDALFSSVVSVVFAMHLSAQTSLPPATDHLQEAILCGALGFYTFKLWSVVTSTRPSLISTLLLAVVLVCVGAAVVKRLFMGELVLTLVSEVHSTALAVERVLKVVGADLQGRLYKLTHALSVLTFFVFRLVPHLLLTVYMWQVREAFLPTPYAFTMGFGGMLFLNAHNLYGLTSNVFKK